MVLLSRLRRAAPQHWERMVNGRNGPFVSVDTIGGLQTFAVLAWRYASVKKSNRAAIAKFNDELALARSLPSKSLREYQEVIWLIPRPFDRPRSMSHHCPITAITARLMSCKAALRVSKSSSMSERKMVTIHGARLSGVTIATRLRLWLPLPDLS